MYRQQRSEPGGEVGSDGDLHADGDRPKSRSSESDAAPSSSHQPPRTMMVPEEEEEMVAKVKTEEVDEQVRHCENLPKSFKYLYL